MTTPAVAAPRGITIAALYGGALVQGLAVVAFPASATVLRQVHGLGDAAYGTLFLPQTALTILAALAGGALARRIGLALLLGLAGAAAAAAMGLLAATHVLPHAAVLPALLAATGCLGLGFGLAAAPLNALPGLLFPSHADSALVAVHTVVGAGFACGPFAIGPLVSADRWVVYPIVAGVVALALAVVALLSPAPAVSATGDRDQDGRGPLAEFAAIAVLYALCEGVFSAWASIFLREVRGVAEASAAFATGGFWIGLVLGRLAVAALVARVPRRRVWLAMPLAMTAVLLTLPLAQGAMSGVALFTLAGLASSAFFPLTVAEATASVPAGAAARTSSLLVAALMLGSGGGSFVLGAARSVASFDTIYRVAALLPMLALVLAARTVSAVGPRRPR